MATELVSLDEIKARLKIPVQNAEADAVLDTFRLALQERVLSIAGFSLTGGVMTEEQVDVQLGVSRLMQFRPIIPLSNDNTKAVTLKARSLASNTFDTILGDIRSRKDGRIMPLASELTPVFPPVGGQANWYRWRQMIWYVVQFTYKVDPLGSATNPIPPSLKMAVLEWAASIFAKPAGGYLESYTAEKISETFNNKWQVMPPIVSALLSPYVRNRASMVF